LPKKRIKKSLGLFLCLLKTTKVLPPHKANRFASALLLRPSFSSFLFFIIP